MKKARKRGPPLFREDDAAATRAAFVRKPAGAGLRR